MVRSLDAEKKAPRGNKKRPENAYRPARRIRPAANEKTLREEAAGEGGERRRILTSYMSFRSVIFMLVLITGMTAVLLLYIKLQSDVTSTSGEVADLEKQLMELRSQNDAAYNEINDGISLEEVREKAINELGMKYSDRDQIVIYSGEEKDSVHQVGEVKK